MDGYLDGSSTGAQPSGSSACYSDDNRHVAESVLEPPKAQRRISR